MKPLQGKVRLEAIQQLGRRCTNREGLAASPSPQQKPAGCHSSVTGMWAADLWIARWLYLLPGTSIIQWIEWIRWHHSTRVGFLLFGNDYGIDLEVDWVMLRIKSIEWSWYRCPTCTLLLVTIFISFPKTFTAEVFISFAYFTSKCHQWMGLHEVKE